MAAVGERLSHYELLAPVPRAGDGATEAFRATDTRSGAAVLVEAVKPDASSVQKARFAVRVRRLQGVQHPALVRIVETAATWCAAEWVEGASGDGFAGLAIARARQKMSWVAQAAAALAILHRAGVVHGQVAAGALLVLEDGAMKLLVPLGGDVGSSPLDDVRALVHVACELLLERAPVPGSETDTAIADRLHDAGLPREAAQALAKIEAGASSTSDDLALRLSPFAELIGPITEPLMPAMRRPS